MLPKDCQESTGFLWASMATQPQRDTHRYKALRDRNYHPKTHRFSPVHNKNKSQLSVISLSLLCERSSVLTLISDPLSIQAKDCCACSGWLSGVCDLASKCPPPVGLLLDTQSHYIWIWQCWQPHSHQPPPKDLPICKESTLPMYRPIVCKHVTFMRNKHRHYF